MVLHILWNLEKENGPIFVQDLEQAVLGDPCKVDFRGLGYGQFGDVLQDMQANKYVALHRRPGEQYWRVGSTNEQTAWIQEHLAMKAVTENDHHDESEDGLVGSNIHQVFHKAHCEAAQKIGTKNRILYESRDEAIQAGKTPCEECRP